jgi:hypothetical protein
MEFLSYSSKQLKEYCQILSIDKLEDLEQLLRRIFEELKDKFSQDMRSYVENKMKIMHSLEKQTD